MLPLPQEQSGTIHTKAKSNGAILSGERELPANIRVLFSEQTARGERPLGGG